MKSRWTTCLLLAAVVAVWGVVAWKIFAPSDASHPIVQSPEPVLLSAPSAVDTLWLDYPDPFLKSAAVPLPSKRLPRKKAPAAPRERVQLIHLGTIAAAGQRFYILSIAGEQYEIPLGGRAGDFRLTACDRDSLFLCKQGIRYGIERCER